MYILRNKSILMLFVLVFAMFLSFNQASAQVTFETDEPTFDGNNPGLSVQDFQAAAVASTTLRSCDESPISSTTDDNCFSPGDILPGIEFVDNPGPDINSLVVLGDSFGGSNNPANVFGNNTIADLLDINFTGTTNAVGLTLGCVPSSGNCAETIVVSVFGAMDNLMDSTNVAVTDAVDSFIGIQSVEAIARISMDFLVPSGGVIKALHEVKFDSTPKFKIVDVNNGACSLTKSSPNGFKIEGATPNKNVAVIMGLKYGSLIINGPVCNGLELGVKQAQIFALGKADDQGNIMFLKPVPPLGDQVNLGFFQVVDVSTCTASEVTMYDILIDEIQSSDNDGDGIVNCQDACPEQGIPNPMFDETLGVDGCIESPCDIRTEVSYNGSCYYLDGSGGSCLNGYVLAPQSVLNTIAPGFVGRDYKTTVSTNCCIWHSEQDSEGQDWGMMNSDNGPGVCNLPGPFSLGPLLGGAGCTDALSNQEQQLTLCVSQEIIID